MRYKKVFLCKCLAVLLVLLLLNNNFADISLAEEVYQGQYSITGDELGLNEPRELDVYLGTFNDSQNYSYIGNESYVNFGEQLSGNSLVVYNSLKKLDVNNRYLQIPLSKSVKFSSATNSPTEEELSSALHEIKKFTQMAIDAYSRDYPENFWLDIDDSYYNFTYYGKNSNGSYEWEISLIVYYAEVFPEYSDNINSHMETFQKAIDSFKVTGTTRYDKLKSIYNRLCDNVTYKSHHSSYQAYGALVNNVSVCSGYAKAFKTICDRENIPCILISGISVDASGKTESHMWNAVKMDDGKWYYVDVTWADRNPICYEFFLSGRDTKISIYNNKTFGASHLPSGDFSSTKYFIFRYPEISATGYDPANTVTPSSVPTPTPVPVENPKIGDINRDGTINALDALLVLRIAAKQIGCTAEMLIYGDMSQDFELDANDALLILKHSAKIS